MTIADRTVAATLQRPQGSPHKQGVPRLVFTDASNRIGVEFVRMLSHVLVVHFKTNCKILSDPNLIPRACEAEGVPLQDAALVIYDAAAAESHSVTFHPERRNAPRWDIVIGPHVTRNGDIDREQTCKVVNQILNVFYSNIFARADCGTLTD